MGKADLTVARAGGADLVRRRQREQAAVADALGAAVPWLGSAGLSRVLNFFLFFLINIGGHKNRLH